MGAWTLDQAKQHLNAWLEAELSVTTSQSYSTGTMTLTRANLGEIHDKVQFWKNEVEKLESSSRRRGTNKVYRVVPRDL